MKTIIIYVAFLLSVFTINTVNAQKQKITEQEKIENIEKTRKEAIENATKEEKHNLEKEIRYIDNLVREGKLSKEEGEELKKKLEEEEEVDESTPSRMWVVFLGM